MEIEVLKEKMSGALTYWELSDKETQDVIFHLTDWMDDFYSLKRVFESADELSEKEVAEILMKFLIHVPNHLAAASKIGLDMPVTDVFDVNSTSESDEDSAN